MVHCLHCVELTGPVCRQRMQRADAGGSIVSVVDLSARVRAAPNEGAGVGAGPASGRVFGAHRSPRTLSANVALAGGGRRGGGACALVWKFVRDACVVWPFGLACFESMSLSMLMSKMSLLMAYCARSPFVRVWAQACAAAGTATGPPMLPVGAWLACTRRATRVRPRVG